MQKHDENIEPIRLKIVVDCPVEDAFELFTEHLGEWWPLASHSMESDAATCAIEPRRGGRVYERSHKGKEHEWGAVTEWDPPRRVAFTWHPDGTQDNDQLVEVTFSVVADGTQVVLTHSGWEHTRAQASAVRSESSAMWTQVLRSFSSYPSRVLVAV